MQQKKPDLRVVKVARREVLSRRGLALALGLAILPGERVRPRLAISSRKMRASLRPISTACLVPTPGLTCRSMR